MKNLRIAATLALALAGVVIVNNAIGAKTQSFDASQVKEIQKVVHEYIVKNPQVLVEASQALQQQQQNKAVQKAKAAISANAQKLFSNKITPSVGNAENKLTIVEFLDYQCSHCKSMSPLLIELLKTNPNIRFVVKGLPIFGESSNYAARAAVAAAQQDPAKFWDFHTKLLNLKEALNKESVMELAKSSGLDVEKIKKDMEKDDVKTHIKDNFTLAQEIGIQGTPVFIVATSNGAKSEYIPGATSKESLLDAIKKVSS